MSCLGRGTVTTSATTTDQEEEIMITIRCNSCPWIAGSADESVIHKHAAIHEQINSGHIVTKI